MMQENLPVLRSVRPLANWHVQLSWVDGNTANVDLSEPIQRLKGLRSLRSPEVFAQVRLEEGGRSLEWPGDIDIGADTLWDYTLVAQGRGDTLAFRRWRQCHALSLSAAAEALGISRRMIAYYYSGNKPVPKTVLLAIKGWESERSAA
jgi:hypothetical protein